MQGVATLGLMSTRKAIHFPFQKGAVASLGGTVQRSLTVHVACGFFFLECHIEHGECIFLYPQHDVFVLTLACWMCCLLCNLDERDL